MNIERIKKYWKRISKKIRHQLSFYSKDEITDRKGNQEDIVKNVEKVWENREDKI